VENVVNSLKEIGYEPTVARGDYKEN